MLGDGRATFGHAALREVGYGRAGYANQIDAAPRKGLTILTDRDGRPMTYRNIARLMRDERARLGLTAYDLHALRYRGVMELAWAGCDDDEIASYSGHSTKKMIAKYAGEARQVMRARQAWVKRRSTERDQNKKLITGVITP